MPALPATVPAASSRGRLAAAVGLLAAALALGASLAPREPAPDDPAGAAPSTAARLVFKNGAELQGEVRGITDGVLDFVSAEGDELPLARAHLRAIEGGPFSDPPILWSGPAPEGVSAERPDAFLRATRDESLGTGSLDVAVAAYAVPDSERRVYLVGAVHIAHAACFAELQSILDATDLVLWEGVGGSEQPSKEALERFDILFRTQILLKNMLNLEFQLEQVDYRRSFWRNSDMTATELQRILDERDLELIPNEKLFKAVFGTLFEFVDPERIGRSERVGRPYRATIAPMMADTEKLFAQAGSVAIKEVLIEMRNDVVMADVERILAEEDVERISVFYGAAHLPDMDVHLREELGLRYVGTHWVPAWTF